MASFNKRMSINSLHAEVIYTFQFSSAEIARNQIVILKVEVDKCDSKPCAVSVFLFVYTACS